MGKTASGRSIGTLRDDSENPQCESPRGQPPWLLLLLTLICMCSQSDTCQCTSRGQMARYRRHCLLYVTDSSRRSASVARRTKGTFNIKSHSLLISFDLLLLIRSVWHSAMIFRNSKDTWAKMDVLSGRERVSDWDGGRAYESHRTDVAHHLPLPNNLT